MRNSKCLPCRKHRDKDGVPSGTYPIMNRRKTARGALILIAAVVMLISVAIAQEKQSVDLIVSGGIGATMDSARAIPPDGSVAVRGDSTVAVGARAGLWDQDQSA